jgi:hypothetical protein
MFQVTKRQGHNRKKSCLPVRLSVSSLIGSPDLGIQLRIQEIIVEIVSAERMVAEESLGGRTISGVTFEELV